MTLTNLQWVQAIWHELLPFWIVGILCWTAVIVDWTERHVAKKKPQTTGATIKIQIPVRYETSDPDDQPETGQRQSVAGVQSVC